MSARRVFILGGGPSLQGFDWRRLDGETVVPVNMAAKFLGEHVRWDSVAFVQDRRALDRLVAMPEFDPWKGRTIWPVFEGDTIKPEPPRGVIRLEGTREWPAGDLSWLLDKPQRRRDEAIRIAGHSRVFWSSHAGPAALNFAAQAYPAGTLYLLGFDYGAGPDAYVLHNFHGEYVLAGWYEPPCAADMERWNAWRVDLERVVARLREDGRRVVNLSPFSTIEGTEKMSESVVIGRAA